MSRYISIFAFLLSVFAAVGLTGSAAALEYYASSTHPFTITDCDGEDLKFDKYNEESGGYYHVFNGWDFGITALSMNSGDRIKAKLPDGYRFNGWYTKTGGWFNEADAYISEANERLTVEQTIDSATIDKAGKWSNLPTIVAKYEIMLFDVTFKCNGGTPSSFESIKDQDITSTGILLPSVSRGGYDLEGWKNGKGKIFEAGSYAGSEFWNGTDRTFYSDLTAQWTGKTYSITLDRGGGMGGSCPGTYTVSESSQGLEITPPTKEGHTIQGWTVSGATGVTPTVAGSPLTLTIPANTYGNLMLTPTWRAATFTITYKPGSGTPGNEYADTKDWGKDTALRGKTYEDPKGQYVQDGWNTTKESFEGEPDYGLKAAYTDNASITLYPHWKLNGYKLTIHHKGAYYDGKLLEETALESLVVGTTNLNEILVAVPTNDAAFYGYYSTEGGSTQIYDEHGKCCNVEGVWSGAWPNGTFAGNANLEVWAKWGPPPEHFTIRAVCDPTVGGTVEPASTNVVKGRDVTLTATKNSGYSFCCWTNSNGAVVSAEPEYSFAVTADATYTAVFTGNVYTVTYKTDGGKPKDPTRVVTFGAAYGEPPSVSQDGYELEGWYTESDGEGIRIDPDTKVFIAENHKLWAHWTEKTEFDVTFVDSIGKRSMTKPYPRDQPIGEAPEETKAWDNTDKGYWQDPDDKWDPPLTTVVTDDMTVTAKWISVSDILDCTNLTFAASGSWKPVADQTAEGGWCMRMDEKTGTDNLTATLKESGILTFHWKGDTGRVLYVNHNWETNFTYRGSGWQEETIPITIGQGASIDLQFTCRDPWLVGNFCAIDHVTWTPGAKPVETYAVTYDKGTYGEGEWRTDTKTNGVDLVLAGALFTRDNYTQDGWSKNEDGSTSDYALGGTYTENAAITLYPHWLENGKYTVSYSAGTDATGFAASQTAHIGETVVLHGDGHFSRTGYSQDGWATSDLGEKAFEFSATYEEAVSTTLYPCWTNNRYTVTFNPNGGSVTPAPKIVTYDAVYGELPSPGVRENYSFTGWTLTSGAAVTAETIVKTAADHELIAQWTQDLGLYSEALDCTNLRFELSKTGWFVCKESPHKGVSCLRSETPGAELTATITESGTLTFWWRGESGNKGSRVLVTGPAEPLTLTVTTDDEIKDWPPEEKIEITASSDNPVSLRFTCDQSSKFGGFIDLDDFTWTPDQKEPEYADTDTPVTGFSMADGKIGFSFVGDGSTYHLLGTNDLVAPMPWPMVFETNKASGTILFDIPAKADEPKMFYRIRVLK